MKKLQKFTSLYFKEFYFENLRNTYYYKNIPKIIFQIENTLNLIYF